MEQRVYVADTRSVVRLSCEHNGLQRLIDVLYEELLGEQQSQLCLNKTLSLGRKYSSVLYKVNVTFAEFVDRNAYHHCQGAQLQRSVEPMVCLYT